MENKKTLGWIFVVFILGVFFGFFFIPMDMKHSMMSMDGMRDSFISLKESIQDENLHNHNYRCCLEKPCTYCIEKTPGHGEGSVCDCLSDLMNGVHPCGECIGEILEGHGNPYLAEYFARAIAEKTGHLDAIKEIISEKYDISIEEQA
tara:strand:- start:219 stop:662 length:444 start_codon:yes stop_codon:yes gene_type:complete